MTRTRVLIVMLLALVLVQWAIAVFFLPRLPVEIPLNFPPNQGALRMEAKEMILLLPGAATLASLIMLAIFPWRRSLINFPGRCQLRDLPLVYSGPVYERAYHLVLIAGIFVSICTGYIMVTICLFSLGTIHDINMWAVYAALGVMALYFLYNNFMLYRLARLARRMAEEGEEPGNEPIEPEE